MSFLLDTDTCSAYLKGNRDVQGRLLQHWGGLSISTVTLGELYTWGHRTSNSGRRLAYIAQLLTGMTIIPIDQDVSLTFGRMRAGLLDQGIVIDTPDLLIASTAMVHDLTLVTQNIRHFKLIPQLRLRDWVVH